MRVTEGKLTGTGLNIAVIASRSGEPVASKLLDGAKDSLMRHDVSGSAIDICRVPEVFELPLVAKELALTGKYDAIIALGAVIPCDDILAAEVARGLAGVSLEQRVPAVFGVLVTETLEQALAQAYNKGTDCAAAAIETANLLRNIRRQNTTEERTLNA